METIWFILWGLLWAIYLILDGFDLGLGALMPVLGTDEEKRKTIYNAAGPYWDGNEVWLITAGGVTFAAFPKAYAVLFSALYAPLLLLLFALIFRAVSFEFRNKVECSCWRSFWDKVHFVSNLAPCILLGVFFANLFMGIPVDANGVYHGSLIGLLNPYGLAGGLLFLAVLVMHGALWLSLKSDGEIKGRAIAIAGLLSVVVMVMLVVFLVMSLFCTSLFANYISMPWLLVLPVVVVLTLINIPKMLNAGRLWAAFLCSAGFIAALALFGVMGMYPGIVISSMDPAATVTAFNGASSAKTLKIMLCVALVMVPIVLAYQFWMYRLFAGPAKSEGAESQY